MKFILLNCASASEKWAEQSAALYHKKINHFVGFEIKEAKAKKSSRDDREFKIRSDSDSLLNEIESEDFVILFDESGEGLDSRQFSQKLNQILISSKRRAVFVIGGAYGVDDRIRQRANLRLSFSKMVMNHLVAQLVAMEQIYRGLTLLKNIPYHND